MSNVLAGGISQHPGTLWHFEQERLTFTKGVTISTASAEESIFSTTFIQIFSKNVEIEEKI